MAGVGWGVVPWSQQAACLASRDSLTPGSHACAGTYLLQTLSHLNFSLVCPLTTCHERLHGLQTLIQTTMHAIAQQTRLTAYDAQPSCMLVQGASVAP